MLLRIVCTSAFVATASFSGAAMAEETVTKMDTSLLKELGTFGTGLTGTLALPDSGDSSRRLSLSEFGGTEMISKSSARRSVKDSIRIQLQDTAIYGIFLGGNQPGGADGAVGVGLERPLDRGVALNLELFQPTSRAKRSSSDRDNTKAALKLLFRF